MALIHLQTHFLGFTFTVLAPFLLSSSAGTLHSRFPGEIQAFPTINWIYGLLWGGKRHEATLVNFYPPPMPSMQEGPPW